MEIQVNLDELEHLSDVLHRITLDTEDILARSKALRSEMELDVGFMSLPQSASILEMLDEAIRSLVQTNEDAISLRNMIDKTPELFHDQERAIIDRFKELTAKLDLFGSQMSSLMTSQQIILEEKNEKMHVANNIERLIADEAMQMEIVNTMACMKIVNEDYPVEEIKGLE
ncbi:MAG: hypothetical protein J6Y58_11150 [Clostridiales bacterium]|nr:hypothetical protein [Clostridiales bacterium]